MQWMVDTIGNIYDVINALKKRPALYIGDNKISSMRSFLDGYSFALMEHSIQTKEEQPIPFWFFHEWVASRYNWYESTAGWCHIILEENNKDEEKALNVFFELFDQFSKLKILSVKQKQLTQRNLDFHFSDLCQVKRITNWEKWNEAPLYENPTMVNILELSDDFGYIYNVVNNKEKEWEHAIYKTKPEVEKRIQCLFGVL